MTSADAQRCRDQLLTLVADESHCATSLLGLLRQESANLATVSTESLHATLAEKGPLLESLQQATTARVACMASFSFGGDTEGINQCCAWCDGFDSALTDAFDLLGQLAEQCYWENQRVGQLSTRRAQYIAQALDSLRMGHETPLHTYRQDGSTNRLGSSRTLASA